MTTFKCDCCNIEVIHFGGDNEYSAILQYNLTEDKALCRSCSVINEPGKTYYSSVSAKVIEALREKHKNNESPEDEK